MGQQAIDFAGVVDRIQYDPGTDLAAGGDAGALFSGAADMFIQANSIEDPDEINRIKKIAANQTDFNRTLRTQGRDFKKTSEFMKTQAPLELTGVSQEERLSEIDRWEEATKKAALDSPQFSAYNDIEFQVGQMAHQERRKVTGQDTGIVKDKLSRFAGSFSTRPIRAIASITDSDSLREAADATELWLEANPEMDQDLSSDIASGLGDAVVSIGVYAGGTALAGPQAGAAAAFSYNAALGYAESYEQVFSATGDQDKAIAAGVASLPGAVVETLADKFIGGKFVTGQLAKRFAAATSVNAKRQVLKEALQDSTVRQAAFKAAQSALVESSAETTGELMRGIGRLAVVDDVGLPEDVRANLFPDAKELTRSALVGGIIGGGLGGAGGVVEVKTKKKEIEKALKQRNIPEAVSAASETEITKEEQQQTTITERTKEEDAETKDETQVDREQREIDTRRTDEGRKQGERGVGGEGALARSGPVPEGSKPDEQPDLTKKPVTEEDAASDEGRSIDGPQEPEVTDPQEEARTEILEKLSEEDVSDAKPTGKALPFNQIDKEVSKLKKLRPTGPKQRQLYKEVKSVINYGGRNMYPALAKKDPALAQQWLELVEEVNSGTRFEEPIEDKISEAQGLKFKAQEHFFNQRMARIVKHNPEFADAVSLDHFRSDPQILNRMAAEGVFSDPAVDSRQEALEQTREKQLEDLRTELSDSVDAFKTIDRDEFIKLSGGKRNQKWAGKLYDRISNIDPSKYQDAATLKNHLAAINSSVNEGGASTVGLEPLMIDDEVSAFEDLVSTSSIAGTTRSSTVFGFMEGAHDKIRGARQQIRALSKHATTQEFFQKKVTAPFRAAMERFRSAEAESVQWFDKKKKDLGLSGKLGFGGISGERLHIMGMLTYLRQVGEGQSPDTALANRFANMRNSLQRQIENRYGSQINMIGKGARRLMNVLDSMEQNVAPGLDGSADAFSQLYDEMLTEPERKLIDATIKHIEDKYRDDVKFAMETVYGEPFIEVEQYLSDQQIPLDGREAAGQARQLPIDARADAIAHQHNFEAGELGHMAPTHERTNQLGENRILVTNFERLAKGTFKQVAFEANTAVERKILNRKLRDGGALEKAVNTEGGTHVPGLNRMNHLRDAYRKEIINEIHRTDFTSSFNKAVNDGVAVVSVAALNSAKHLYAQPLSAFAHFGVSNATDPTSWKFLGEALSGSIMDQDMKDFIKTHVGSIVTRTSDDPITDQQLGIGDVGPSMDRAKFIKQLGEKTKDVSTWMIRQGDKMSARPVFLAEYALAERRRMKREGLQQTINSLTDIDWNNPNQESLTEALDNLEDNVNTSRTAAKGELFQNNNTYATAFRSALFAFQGHTFNLASQAEIEFRNLKEWGFDLQRPEVRQAAKLLASITAQTAVFRLLSHATTLGVAGIAGAYLAGTEETEGAGDDEYDKLIKRKAFLDQLDPKSPVVKAQKQAVIEEIRYAEGIRNMQQDRKAKMQSGGQLATTVLNDTLSSMFVPFTIAESVGNLTVPNIVLTAWDRGERESFQQVKEDTLKRLRERRNLAKKHGAVPSVTRLEKEIATIEASNYVPLAPPKFISQPTPGPFGMGFKSVTDGIELAQDAIAGNQEVSTNDLILWISSFGLAPNELKGFLREIDKYEDRHDEMIRKSDEDNR